MATKAEVIQSVQADIASQTQDESISPAILAAAIVNAVNLINTAISAGFRIENNVLVGFTNDVVIPEGVTELAGPITNDNTGDTIGVLESRDISSISLPQSLEIIGSLALRNNFISGTLVLGNNITELRANALQNNELDGIVLSTGLTVLSEDAISDNKIVVLDIPTSITRIESGAARNNLIESLVLHDGITEINGRVDSSTEFTTSIFGSGAFSNNKINNLVLSSGLTEIAGNTFAGNEIPTIPFPVSITAFRYGCFSNNLFTGSLVFGDQVTDIERFAFQGNNITDVEVSATCNLHPDSFDAGVTINRRP